ncbi:tetratricopeptide repeat protein [Rhodoferax sp. GW822-FHT02A01]|uniref:tetratricopeptide repeat protein n=1 Tax=Rhodoferax sp. GW822-FHT02A01 TaxID=3141537 RepID=UPI00315D0E80
MKLNQWLCATLLLGLAGSASAAGVVSSSPPPMAEQLAAARKMMDGKDWRNAGYQLEQALRMEPRNPDVLNLLGYFNRKKPAPELDKAFDFYKKALAIDPNHKGAHEYIGEAYLMARQPEEAQKHLAMLESICGNRSCEEYEDLAEAIKKYQPVQ